MNRNEFLTMREQLMSNIDCIVDSTFGDFYPLITPKLMDMRDELATKLCDMVCETMDPVGLPEDDDERGHPGVVNRPHQRWVSTVCR